MISLHYNFIYRTLWIISLTCELYDLDLQHCQLNLKTVASPEDKRGVLLKHCVAYFTCCDNGNRRCAFETLCSIFYML